MICISTSEYEYIYMNGEKAEVLLKDSSIGNAPGIRETAPPITELTKAKNRQK